MTAARRSCYREVRASDVRSVDSHTFAGRSERTSTLSRLNRVGPICKTTEGVITACVGRCRRSFRAAERYCDTAGRRAHSSGDGPRMSCSAPDGPINRLRK